MRGVAVTRKEDEGEVTLSFRFKSINQLLDPDDPAPLPDTELAELAEENLWGYLNEFRLKALVNLNISIPAAEITPEKSSLIPEAVRRHFAFRIQDIRHDELISRREGRYSLAIAIGNALIAILFLFIVTTCELSIDSPPILLIGAFITIMNWVTIWDTYEHFLYDYRGIVRKRKLYEKISRIPVSVEGY